MLSDWIMAGEDSDSMAAQISQKFKSKGERRAQMHPGRSNTNELLKSTNWIKFQEIIYHNIPGNSQIDNLDSAVQKFNDTIANAISASTSTRVINTPHLRLPENIRQLIGAKNRFRKLWNNTRYPPYKREVNALIRQTRKEIETHKNSTWKDLLTLNPQDNSLYNRKITKRATVIPRLHGPGGMTSDFEKAEAFKDTLEVTFQENVEPYYDDKIEEVENVVSNYFDNFTTLTLPLMKSEASLKNCRIVKLLFVSNRAVGSALDILAPDTSTHFNSRHSNAILDIGFAVNLSYTEVFTINTLSSDHNPVIFDFVTNNVLPPILRTLKTTNWIKFQEIIYHDIPGNPRIDDLDLAVQNFTSNISNAISASTSTRLINTPHLRLPENIRELIRAKNRFRKLWNDTRYPPYKREVNALIRQIRREIQEHKNRTWKDYLLTLNAEDNSLYNLHRKFSKRHIPFPPLHGPGGMAYSDFKKAEAFKDTLEVTFQENEEPYCDDKIEEVENLVDDYFDNFATCTPPLTSPSEVRGIIKKLQNRKAAGPDQIPNIAFKYFTQNALTHLTKLHNQCLIKNHFPTLWKQANVIMLAKPNQDRTYPQGYRPISLINTTAKIFERIILTRIKSHCKAIDCIPPEQCGFREGHSTLHQLIRVTNIINEGFAHKFYTVGVFLDVKRAFDKMWHDGLTYKLIKLQFPDYLIKIIHNFLHNRTFRVRVNNSYSNTGSCLSGVPQGSVLSPYLYNIYTHDFPQHSTVSTCLFADDSAVLSQGVQLKYTIKTVQHFLDKLETWLTHWRIAINVDKSQAIVFRKWGVIDPPFQLSLFDDNIQWVPVVKYLGLHIDSRLTFKKHIDYLSEKFWRRISLAISFVRRRSPLSLENKVILYKQILRPVITYGSPVWGAAAATHMKKIQTASVYYSLPLESDNCWKKQTGSLLTASRIFFPTWNFSQPRGPKWGLPPPPSPDDRNMDFSSSDSEEENMETRLAINMHGSLSPPLAPPSIKTLEDDYQSIENSISCADFIIELQNLIVNLDSYRFDNTVEKEQYHNGLMKIFKNGTELRERLRSAEQERCSAAISKIDMDFGIPSKAKPFTTVKGKKGNRKTPSPPPERHTSKKLKTDDVDTTNRYDGLPVEDPPATVDNDEGNEDVYQDLASRVPKFRKPPPITIDNAANSAALLKKLQTLTKEDFMGSVIGKGLRVYPNTPRPTTRSETS
ncbi:RNA-directed DNA polymerase from mobile element jockey [Trichonephila clavipes]|nr:RNA-directed DNA polymerase from mobile element jockey [Trichonephila clavipes]